MNVPREMEMYTLAKAKAGRLVGIGFDGQEYFIKPVFRVRRLKLPPVKR
jgi:hypothetical protein